MKRRNVRRRLTLHFTYQMLMLFVFVTIFIAILILTVIQLVLNDGMKRSYPVGALDAIVMETFVDGKGADVPERWEKQLFEEGYWLQVVLGNGKVIYSANKPEDIPEDYNLAELLRMEQTGRFGSYELMMDIDETVADGALFVLGYRDERYAAVRSLYETYAVNGRLEPAEQAFASLDEELRSTERTLHIVDEEGSVLQRAGAPLERDRYRPLDLLLMEKLAGTYPTNVSFYQDSESGTVWVLHEAKRGSFVKQPIMKEVIIAACIIGATILAATLAFSIYHGYRYGRPLLLFIDWFGRLGRGPYEELLTDKEKKRLYRRNGKLKRRFKLYQEVIDGFRDMTEKLHAAERDRARLEQTREEWMTGISHDLRTPLSSIQGYGHLLESGQYRWTEEELREMGGVIREKSDFMIDLIQDFSLAFQLKNRAMPFERKPIRLQEFARRRMLLYVNDRTMEHASFRYEDADGEEEEPIYVLANDKWFARLLDNLLVNAVKHNPVSTTVSVRVSQAGGEAVIAVRDDGAGMDEETLRNLFERYYRGTSTDEGTDGAGLGMSIAKSIAEAHGGSIQAESRVGCGTTITLRFPIVRAAEERTPA
ncbi:sensor histidine kinase [Paenibacillus soyae]|uniref:histidine kinase n=1 Tax=Paenibacillus soyae TaxID=2969249 RepID=A0A9X2MNS1_9BACL|nr:HAMP domain-containing sensor histidine kinase [Paenibacillus soyae]MCR2804129.1 HAMP domain-containing histidine kinase [Paenibacillus soyae]